MSLIDQDNYATKTEVVARAFFGLFEGNDHIKNHESIDLVLPATTLADYCYACMFYGCTSLTKAPELPATTLSESCYARMFYGCTGLTTAPVLPATTLPQACYTYMFYGCSSLNSVTCLATNIGFSNCTYNWLADVSASGNFYYASGTTWTEGSANGIPSGWSKHVAN